MASNTAIYDNLYHILENTFKTNPKTKQDFRNVVSNYLDRNMSKLSSAGPTYKILFIDSDRNSVHNITNISAELVNRAIIDSAYIKNHWRNIASPFNVIMALIIIYAKRNNDPELSDFALMYLTLSMYSSLHAKYFKYQPNPQVMDYTINNLSKKYKLKQHGTIWNALLDTAKVCDKTYTNNIKRASDKDITDYIEALKTRLNALLRKIMSEFIKNSNDKRLMGIERDNEDADSFSRAESNTYLIERLSNSVALKMTINGPDMKVVTIAAKLNDVSLNDLRTVVTSLLADKENSKDVKQLISDILVLFLSSGKYGAVDVRSNKFIIETLAIYKKSNTNDKSIRDIKRLLDKWLALYSTTYKKSNRAATLNNFRKALYVFFVLSIQTNTPSN